MDARRSGGYDFEALAHAMAVADAERRSFPLKNFGCRSWAQEKYIRSVLSGLDTYWHSGNGSGKSLGSVALDTAILTGLSELGGYYLRCPRCVKDFDPREHPAECPKCRAELVRTVIEIPVLRPPVSWGLGVPTYKIAAGSTLPMIRFLLGKHPHVELRQGNRNTVTQIMVRHALSDSLEEPDETWSTLFVLPYDGERPEGLRLDGGHCDEPPPEDFLDALRTRKKAARRLYLGISATPIKSAEWMPIRSQYPDELLTPENGRIRIQSSVYDNTALTGEDIAEIEKNLAHRRPAVRLARLMGEHTNDDGDNPFDPDVLAEMLEKCREPKVEEVRIEREVDTSDGRRLRPMLVRVESWLEPDETDVFFITADIGKGIRDGKHDPCCLHVWSRRRRTLAARVNEYLGGYGLAQIAARLARKYGNCEVDPPTAGGYGEAFLSGLRQAGYYRIAHNKRHDRPGSWMQRLGFTESRSSNAEWFGAMEAAFSTRSVTIWSKDAVRTLMDLVKDENGKIEAGPGHHDEDWVCAGRAVYKLSFDTGKKREWKENDPRAGVNRLLRMLRRDEARASIPVERW